MKLTTDTVITRLQPYALMLKRYAVFIFIVLVLGTYVFLVQHIGALISKEPTQAQIDSKAKPVNKLVVDQEAVKKISELESQNIDVQTLFDNARENPFTE